MATMQSETSLDRAKRERAIGRAILSGKKPGIVARLHSTTVDEVNAIAARYRKPKPRGRAS